MPIHNPAYRAWDGVRNGEWGRLWTICVTGVARAYQSKWLKRLTFVAFLPLLFFAVPFFLFEQSARDPATWQAFSASVRNLPQASVLRESIGGLPRQPTPEQFDTIRHQVWSFLLLTMLRYSQSFLIVLVIGIVAPPLISQDLRTRAYLIYFSRPISRTEYIAGKVGVVGFFLISFSALPPLVLYIAGLLLSPSLEVALTTWDLPLRILIGSACLIFPATLVALAFSSLTLESRYAAFAWFAMWIVGHVSYSVLVSFQAFNMKQDPAMLEPGWRVLTSPYQVVATVQSYIFGFEVNPTIVLPAFGILVVASTLSLLVLYRRVNAPMRA